MADPIRFGLVGAGGIARAYVDASAELARRPEMKRHTA